MRARPSPPCTHAKFLDRRKNRLSRWPLPPLEAGFGSLRDYLCCSDGTTVGTATTTAAATNMKEEPQGIVEGRPDGDGKAGAAGFATRRV